MKDEYVTTNLLLAAMLIAGNASIADIEVGGRFSKVKIDMSSLDVSILVSRFRKLADELELAGTSDDDKRPSPVDYSPVYDRSVLGDIEDKYLRLKRMIFQARK
jgi:hypothetical protein